MVLVSILVRDREQIVKKCGFTKTPLFSTLDSMFSHTFKTIAIMTLTTCCSQLDAVPQANPRALQQIAKEAKKQHSEAVVISQKGKILLDMHSGPTTDPTQVMSVTKSFVNLAVGLLIAEGHLSSVNLPCHHIYPEWKGGEKEVITIRHLLTHTSGIAEDWEKDQMQESEDIVQLILHSSLSAEPGTEFRYNNKATTLLADVVYRLSGEPVDLYLDKRLFQPLGIRNYSWSKDPKGQRYGHAGAAFTSYDLLKIGQLLLNNGQWEGRQILPPSWIALSTQTATPLNCVCGLLWWIELNSNNIAVGYSARGYKGQYLIIVPSRGIVAVRQSDISGYETPPPDSQISFANFPKLVGKL